MTGHSFSLKNLREPPKTFGNISKQLQMLFISFMEEDISQSSGFSEAALNPGFPKL